MSEDLVDAVDPGGARVEIALGDVCIARLHGHSLGGGTAGVCSQPLTHNRVS